MTQQTIAYYTDDITLLPANAIWRFASRTGFLGPFLFCFFYLRKLLRLPFRANYGAPYPDTLPINTIEGLPPEARDAFARLFPEFQELGFTLAFCTHTSFIGTKWGASALFLNAEGDIYATIVWIRVKLGPLDRSETAIACHSTLTSGATISTGPLKPERWIPEMIPPGVAMNRLPEMAALADALKSHRELLRTSNSPPQRFNQTTLQQQMLTTGQRLYDHLIGKGLYRKLSDAEVNRLSRLR